MNELAKEIDCPFCGKSKISIIIIPGFYSYNTSFAIHQKKRIPVYHPEKIEINSHCPQCGTSKKNIKEALGKAKEISHEERLRRIKEAGLPTKLEY